MIPSKLFQELKFLAVIGEKTLLTITRDLAKELVKNGKSERRPINDAQVRKCTKMFLTGTYEEGKSLIVIGFKSNLLIDGQHILSGFINSNIPEIKFNVIFMLHDT